MTREEAITWCDRFNDAWANADPEDDFPDLKYSDTLDQLFYLAGQALRQQEAVTKCNDLYDEDGGEILNDEAVTNRHQLTNADRIRAMSDEELVNVVPCPSGFSMFRCPIERQCGPCKREWLQQPAEEEDHA